MTITVRLEPELHQALDRIARAEGLTRSQFVRECLQEYIACKQEKLSAWELGKDLFGRHSSGRGDLSLRRKEILKEKVRAAKGRH